MIHYLTMGTVLGLSAGFSPGPLLTLVISETLQHDIRSGVKVALAPIITDLPIIILTLFILSKLSSFHNILGLISVIGGCVILWMGCEGLRTKALQVNARETRPKSLAKGVVELKMRKEEKPREIPISALENEVMSLIRSLKNETEKSL